MADEPGGEDSDFGSVDDDAAREKINSQRKENSAIKKSEPKLVATTSRMEAAIRIHVDNFR